MIKHGFDMYRVFISAPGDLEHDRQACHEVVTRVNKSEAMPFKVLLVTVDLMTSDHILSYRSIVSDNVRWCTYFIQIFEDDWGPKNLFRKLFFLAAECRDDANFPMREIVVCLKDAPRETDPEILAFRKELAECPNVRLLQYSDAETLQNQIIGVCSGWVQSIIAAGGGVTAPAS
jgi:hypothetical protein